MQLQKFLKVPYKQLFDSSVIQVYLIFIYYFIEKAEFCCCSCRVLGFLSAPLSAPITGLTGGLTISCRTWLTQCQCVLDRVEFTDSMANSRDWGGMFTWLIMAESKWKGILLYKPTTDSCPPTGLSWMIMTATATDCGLMCLLCTLWMESNTPAALRSWAPTNVIAAAVVQFSRFLQPCYYANVQRNNECLTHTNPDVLLLFIVKLLVQSLVLSNRPRESNRWTTERKVLRGKLVFS